MNAEKNITYELVMMVYYLLIAIVIVGLSWALFSMNIIVEFPYTTL